MPPLRAHHLARSDSDVCPCCGRTTRRVTGRLFRDGVPCGVYAARWSPDSRDHGLLMLVSFAADDQTGRRAAVLDWRFTETGPGCMVVDPTADHWPDLAEKLGPLATRQAVLGGPWREELFHFADHIVFQDPFVHEFLYAPAEDGA
jgi:hypothetical protein